MLFNYYLFTEWNFALPMDFTVTAGASLNKNEFGIMNMLKNNHLNDTTSLIFSISGYNTAYRRIKSF